jgi:serine/threonine-protein kinase
MPDRGTANARVTKLGRYEVLSELGKGAMGIVYLAKDPVIGRMVAIKTIRMATLTEDDAEAREFRERFIREAQTAGILSHPNIVTIHDIGEDGDSQTSFIAMEYIEGRNVKSLLAEKLKFSWDQIADITAQIAEALDYAHRKGIIHRDIKPANVIITTDGKIKITDFGIAKIASSNLTTTGQFLGTPNYMSPEQVSGAPVDGRSDIFSLGVVLYELLTHRKPFQGDNLTAISYKIVHEDFTPPAALSADIPTDFNSIVSKAMAKDPWNRYQRGKDFALALHQLRARMEEQKALQDLGTMVSEVENLPTLKLANLDQLASSAVAPPSQTSVPQPVDTHPTSERSKGKKKEKKKEQKTAEVRPVTAAAPSIAPVTVPRKPPAPVSPGVAGEVTEILDSSPLPPASLIATPIAPSASAPPRVPTNAKTMVVHGSWQKVLGNRVAEWKTLSKRQINPRWFYGVSAAAAAVLILIVSLFLLRATIASRPSVPHDPGLEAQNREVRQALEEGRRLLSAGNYEQSLALFRQVLKRSPGNQQARQYAQMAENALRARQDQSQKSVQATALLEQGRAALASGDFESARRHADEALVLDGGMIAAQELREQAVAKISEAEKAAAAAGRKRTPRAREQVARAGPAEQAGPVAPAPVSAAPAPGAGAAASGAGTLRLLFDSPISEGHVMVAVNDRIVLRRPFSFTRKEGLFKSVKDKGTVDASFPVSAGAVTVKVWLSGPDIAPSFASAAGQLEGGASKTLRLDYVSGQLSARIQ